LTAIFETNLPGIERYARGKVRDVYSAGEYLVIVATDRLSAFDYILPTPIPDKGRVLTAMTLFWLEQLREIVPNHLVSADVGDYPKVFHLYRDQLEGRSMLVHRARMVEVECVARGYVSGSGWKDYRRDGRICGIELPSGLLESSQLPGPIFTPASKAQSGHDENISFETVAQQIGAPLAGQLRDLTLGIYQRAAQFAETRGIIIADTKFEFGFVGDGSHAERLVLADEVLTPDSSRFWPRASYRPGGPQASFDKQYVRDYLESIHWDKRPPAPALPADVIERTSEKYREAYRVLTGKSL
jgi:phosphoribosylaminoimidazole-succinocarboxamide synthase